MKVRRDPETIHVPLTAYQHQIEFEGRLLRLSQARRRRHQTGALTLERAREAFSQRIVNVSCVIIVSLSGWHYTLV